MVKQAKARWKQYRIGVPLTVEEILAHQADIGYLKSNSLHSEV